MKLDDWIIEVLTSWMIDTINWAEAHDDYSIVCSELSMMLEE